MSVNEILGKLAGGDRRAPAKRLLASLERPRRELA